jgi:DNA polymerase
MTAPLAAIALAREVHDCRRCFLATGRTQAVTWRGSLSPGVVLFVGEAPGKDEDAVGEPFVGPSGQLLQAWIDGPLGLKPGEWLIANAVNCFPHDEYGKPVPPPLLAVDACAPFLSRLIAIVKPGVIVALGRSAERALERIGISDFLFSYHPAFYLRSGRPWLEDLTKLGDKIRAVRKVIP